MNTRGSTDLRPHGNRVSDQEWVLRSETIQLSAFPCEDADRRAFDPDRRPEQAHASELHSDEGFTSTAARTTR